MDFTFTEEQIMLRDGISRYLKENYTFDCRQRIVDAGGHSRVVWSQFADMGITALRLPSSGGGFEGTISDLVAIMDLFGRHLVVEPFIFAVVFAGSALALAPQNHRAQTVLAEIAQGQSTAAFAHEEGAGVARLEQIETRVVDGVLTGQKEVVMGASEAGTLIVTAATDTGWAVLMVDPASPGLALTPYRTMDGRSAARIQFTSVRLPADAILTTNSIAIQRLIREALVVLCADALGAMEATFEQTSAYAATRRQFDTPLARFQAVAHRLADMKIACVKARATLMFTTALAESKQVTDRDVSILKSQIGRLGRSVAESAVQIHGGIGMTDELAIGHYLKRLLVIEKLFGDTNYHLRCIGHPEPS